MLWSHYLSFGGAAGLGFAHVERGRGLAASGHLQSHQVLHDGVESLSLV